MCRESRPPVRAERRSDDLRERVGVAREGQLAQPNAVNELGHDLGCDLQGEAGLADSADTGERDEPRHRELLGDRGQFLVAADERAELHREVARVGVEGTERGKVHGQAGRDELIHALGTREVTQAVFAEVDQLAVRRHGVAQQLLGRQRDEYLAAVGCAHETRRLVHRGAVVVALTRLSGSRVNPDAYSQTADVAPVLCCDGALCRDCGECSGFGSSEGAVDAVAGHLHDVSVVGGDCVTQDPVVACQHVFHRLGVLLPEAGRALEVGEQERDRPGRQVSHRKHRPRTGACRRGSSRGPQQSVGAAPRVRAVRRGSCVPPHDVARPSDLPTLRSPRELQPPRP